MPRTSRQKSESGIYHIILKGSSGQEIFHDEEDRYKFLDMLEKYKQKSGLEVYGWCLMSTHVHLLIKEGQEDLATTMKRIGVSFVGYYHWKYETAGHLFQDRYRSEEVENDSYLVTVIRYIHQNPVKANLVDKPQDWKWSSCLGYYGEQIYPRGLLDKELILKIFAQDEAAAVRIFREYNEKSNKDECLDETTVARIKDEEARQRIERLQAGIRVAQIKSLPREQRDEIVKKATCIEGISQRQLSRVLGISQALISKIARKV